MGRVELYSSQNWKSKQIWLSVLLLLVTAVGCILTWLPVHASKNSAVLAQIQAIVPSVPAQELRISDTCRISKPNLILTSLNFGRNKGWHFSFTLEGRKNDTTKPYRA